MSKVRNIAAAIGLVCISAGTAVYSAAISYGKVGDPTNYDRTINVTAKTKAINVRQGEAVRIMNAETKKSFVWLFDGHELQNFDLTALAPAGVLTQPVRAFVAERNPCND